MRALGNRWTPLDGTGRSCEPTTDARPLWVHLELDSDVAVSWLRASGLEVQVVDALLAEATRPRCVRVSGGHLIVLRGVNLNPGSEPEDMVSVRILLQGDRVITVEHRHARSLCEVLAVLEAGHGPASAVGFVASLVEHMADNAEDVLEQLEETVDALEDDVLDTGDRSLRASLSTARSRAIRLRRHLGPQRDALARLVAEDLDGLVPRVRAELRELAEQHVRLVEDLDALHARAAVVQDEIHNRLSDLQSRNTWVLAVVAGMFLPLTFITGLLGANIGGIPGQDSPWGFAVLVGLLAVLAGVELVLFWRMRWL